MSKNQHRLATPDACAAFSCCGGTASCCASPRAKTASSFLVELGKKSTRLEKSTSLAVARGWPAQCRQGSTVGGVRRVG